VSVIGVGTPRCQGDISYSQSWEGKGMCTISSTKRDADLAGLSSDGTHNYRTEYRETCPIPEA